MQAYFFIAPLLVGLAFAGFDPMYDPYTDIAQLYRMQLLANAFGNQYSPDSLPMEGQGGLDESAYWPDLSELDDQTEVEKNAIYNDPLYSGAHLRDQEHIEHSALHGYQSVAGGTAEGPANNKITKTDKSLPAYCNPPNPCPLGKTAKDNCVENFENSAENNKKLLSEQECPCDTEHMFSCPAGSATVSSKGQSASQRMALNKVIDQLSKAENSVNNLESDDITPAQRKRITLVAKKSPHIIHKRSEIYAHSNPFFEGSHKRIADKKSPKSSQNSMGWRLSEILDDTY